MRSVPNNLGAASSLLKRVALGALVVTLAIFLLTRPLQPQKQSLKAAYDEFMAAPWQPSGDSQTVVSASTPDPYAHQLSAHIPKDAISHRQCDAVAAYELQALLAKETDLTSDSSPLVFHFHDGKVVDQDNDSFRTTQEFCSVLFVPQGSWENSTKQPAVEGFGPDSIHAELRSEDIRIIFQEPDYWGMLLRSDERSALRLAIYTIPYALNHPGNYQIEAEVEYRNYDWVKEQDVDIPRVRLPMVMTNITADPQSPAIKVTGLPVSRPNVRCYTSGASRDYRGRWYRATSFAKDGNQTALNPKAHLDFADHNTTVDEWGWTFAPDNCHLVYFTPEEHVSCLEGRTLQILGDSNSRRTMKTIISGGVNWCQDTADRTCQCSDTKEKTFVDAVNSTISLERFERTDTTDDPTDFGRNSKIFFDFVGGLIIPRPFNHWSKYYNHSGFDGTSITERRIAHYGAPDLVHISFLGYDTTLLRSTQEVIDALPSFKETIYKAHPPGTRFIHRTASSMCCGNEATNHRWTSPRFKFFNHMWRTFWEEDEANDVVRTVDVSVLQGRKEIEMAYPCLTTHMRASLVRIEAMMWMTATCEKNPFLGGAAMRDWGI
ncbi:hypothetical protein FH972_026449 [Carpinus fangiana]|uniref:Uncharacterized protein n=1 Tax=Carpinus fangiana TaxID=176857 RepID=A0A5N6L4C3_9ROSI|nr:hypothetical protein FH972_026449 [Carpinus fangiana]